jgi:hypothetical protein
MSKEEIVLRIKSDGSREVEANGFVGKACEKATDAMLRELGGKGRQSKKPSYHQQEKEKGKEVGW